MRLPGMTVLQSTMLPLVDPHYIQPLAMVITHQPRLVERGVAWGERKRLTISTE